MGVNKVRDRWWRDITNGHLSETLEAAKYGRVIPPWKTIGEKNVMRIWRKKEEESEFKCNGGE